MQCSICGIVLNALNMSDIEDDKCQDCVREIVDKIDTNDESTETRYLSDGVLDSIIRQNKPSSNGRQRMNRWYAKV